MVERYSLKESLSEGEKIKRNKTAYRDGLAMAVWAWITDYLELGGDIWELINGDAVGVQLTRQDCGMAQVFAEDRLSVAKALVSLMDLYNLPIPQFMKNYTQLLS
ncbi:MAG: hypothetical protein GF308_03265 [Candidatus Heimdallarchaeota archaeon]|nr:hypothetical protein [Candidatus Heimdallarchaeota archaeon]